MAAFKDGMDWPFLFWFVILLQFETTKILLFISLILISISNLNNLLETLSCFERGSYLLTFPLIVIKLCILSSSLSSARLFFCFCCLLVTSTRPTMQKSFAWKNKTNPFLCCENFSHYILWTEVFYTVVALSWLGNYIVYCYNLVKLTNLLANWINST